jgi:SAM-dependent methyltransferase
MMFGSKEEFEYAECLNCGALQVVDIPSALGRHYPAHYLGDPGQEATKPIEAIGCVRWFLRAQRSAYLLGCPNALGWLINKVGPDYFKYPWSWFRNARITPRSTILDIGCGPGYLIDALRVQGFTRAIGQDLFQSWTLPGVTVLREPLERLRGRYDLVMLHHSFEHMPDPISVMRRLKELCAIEGTILLRVPVAGCLAWKEYRENWFQIDAPRHLVIPSVQSLRLLAEKTGLRLWRIEFDSTEDQFACSEQYRLGIPLRDPRTTYQRKDSMLFTHEQKKAFADRAKVANESGEGDQACFYFSHA